MSSENNIAMAAHMNRNWRLINRKKKKLMRFPPTIDETDSINSAEHSLKLVDKLISEGVSVNFATESGELALHSAINSNNFVLAEKLINLGADVNLMRCTEGAFQNCTPLHVAVEKRNKDLVKLLLRHNASVNVQHVTPVLTRAVRKEDFELVDLLLTAGADLNPENKLGKPLHMAIATNNYSMVKHLIRHGADVNGISRNRTALETAVKREQTDLIKLLLENGANVHDCKDGYSLLCLAIEKDNFKIVELLVDAGADLNPVGCCIAPLHWAIIQKNSKLVAFLINRGANVNIVGLEIGADINYQDSFGKLPIDNVDCDDKYGLRVLLEQHILKLLGANLYVSKKNLKGLHYNNILASALVISETNSRFGDFWPLL